MEERTENTQVFSLLKKQLPTVQFSGEFSASHFYCGPLGGLNAEPVYGKQRFSSVLPITYLKNHHYCQLASFVWSWRNFA